MRDHLSQRRSGWARAGLAALGGGLLLAACATPSGPTHVLGATETIRVLDAELDFLALVDTGAHSTSIHAIDLRIAHASDAMAQNIGKPIVFRVANERGETREVRSTISAVVWVSTANGSEPRYRVPLRLRWQGVEKRIEVNLRDRRPLTYKLLIGRDWIQGDFLVDVSRNVPVDAAAGPP
ncbi:MAG: RimK/LysX family protein [Myxococcota bacterium]